MGLHEYSLPKHQPHPPGYPLYILMGKILSPVFGNDVTTLAMMSAIFGSLTIIPLFLLLKKIFNQNSAIIGCLLFLLTPVSWLLSISALTDMVGLFFLTLTAYLFYICMKDKQKTIWVSFLAGISIGVRFNEFPVLIALLLWIMIKQRNLKYAFYQGISLILGGLTWLIPMILITGIKEFYDTFTSNGAYVAEHDLLLGNTHSVLGLLKTKLLLLIPLFKIGYTLPLTILFLLSLGWVLMQKKLFKENWIQFCLVYVTSYSILLLTFFNLELPRHILPLIIPMIIIILYPIYKLMNKHRFLGIISLGLLFITGTQAYSQVERFHKAVPTTIGPVLYVKEHFNPNNTVIYASYTLRNFQYYAPEFKSIDNKSDKSVITPEKTVITDLVDLNKDPALNTFQEIETKYFQSDKDIFPKVDSLQLHILKHNP